MYMPLLHRPIFERRLDAFARRYFGGEGKWKGGDEGGRFKEGTAAGHQEHGVEEEKSSGYIETVDEGFAAILLLVCACAARWSDDPRVLLEEDELGFDARFTNNCQDPQSNSEDDEDSRATRNQKEEGRRNRMRHYSAGWKWYIQVQRVRTESVLVTPTLEDLQFYCVSISLHCPYWNIAECCVRSCQLYSFKVPLSPMLAGLWLVSVYGWHRMWARIGNSERVCICASVDSEALLAQPGLQRFQKRRQHA